MEHAGLCAGRAASVAHHRSDRGGGHGGGRLAILRSVSCFTRPTTCELLPDFLSTFASPGDFDEWNGAAGRDVSAPRI